MNDCIFCQVISGDLPGTFVYKDDEVVVIKDIHPVAPVHLLVIPTTHVDEFMQADDALIAKVFRVVKKIIDQQKIAGYRLVTNGKGAALIDHLHVHILGNVDKNRKL